MKQGRDGMCLVDLSNPSDSSGENRWVEMKSTSVEAGEEAFAGMVVSFEC